MILELAEQHGVEQVIFCSDASVGLKAIIVIHDSTFGPAAGGTRLMSYPTEAEALDDAIRLATGMTRKCTLARTACSGETHNALASRTRPSLRNNSAIISRAMGAAT